MGRSSLNVLPGPNGAYAAFLNELDDQDQADAIRSCQLIASGTTSAQIRQLMSIWGVSYFEGPNELDINGKVNAPTTGTTRYYTQTPTFDWCVEENPDLSQLTVTERPSILAFNCGDPITLPMIPAP